MKGAGQSGDGGMEEAQEGQGFRGAWWSKGRSINGGVEFRECGGDPSGALSDDADRTFSYEPHLLLGPGGFK